MNDTKSSDDLASLILLIAVTVINIPGLVLDIFLLVVFIKSKRLQTLDNSFLINLAVCDFLFGLSCFGYVVFLNVSFKDKEYENQLCMIMHIATGYLSVAQLTALVLFTVDRFVKIVHPFTYNRICSRRNVILLLTLSHVLLPVLVVTSIHAYQWDGEHYCLYFYLSQIENLMYFCIIMFCVLLFRLGLNLKILMVARRQSRQIQAQPQLENAQAANTKSIGKVIVILTLFTFVAYIPSWFYAGLFAAGVEITDAVADSLAFGTVTLWSSSYLVDVLAFLLCRKDVKECTLQFLKAREDR